ncbi:inosine-uridine preferring nucleoside hydrolase isoform X1 [Folsomia candida]|uniref:inosine-uridine preferring nucleoside hydrolase isoform X1 n=1 Tax=Folsomia candida TaxID=158441 RepID=UPI000B905D95|nr:inosine-uridine preferring nucleoside hydrolase isoform X1 [Folsomia candida]
MSSVSTTVGNIQAPDHPHFILIDTDAGTDDALAIFLMIKAHQNSEHPIHIVGITTVNGNTSVNNVTENVAMILKGCGAEELCTRLYKGSSAPIVHPFRHKVEPYHGEDGFGDVEDREQLLEDYGGNIKISAEHGVAAIVRLAKEYYGQLTILALGPLTNLAMAVRIDPTIRSSLKSIYCMGGNIEGEGNATISAEFNFAIDPEAAFITLSEFQCEITVVPWEVCKRQAISKSWRTSVLGQMLTPQSILLNKIEMRIIEKSFDVWIPCDQLAAAVLVDSKAIITSKSIHCTVELQGHHTRGLLILDHMGIRRKEDNVRIVTELDKGLVMALMLWAVGGEKP